MQFGFAVATTRGGASPEQLVRQVQAGEELGYDIVGVPDHLVIPRAIESTYPYSPDGSFAGGQTGECLEQLSVAMFLAAKTSRIRILTSVMVVPHRPPVLAAKALATIDVLSGGRLTVGIGVGWLREEFDALGLPDFDRRGAVSTEYIQAFKEMWTSGSAGFQGRYVRVNDERYLPTPVQRPHPPIWIGGESPAALRRAGRHGDAWYPIGNNPAHPMDTAGRLADAMSVIRRHARDAGRDESHLSFAYNAVWQEDPAGALEAESERKLLSGEDEQIASDIRSLDALGVRHLIVGLQGATPEETLERMERFAVKVKPLAR